MASPGITDNKSIIKQQNSMDGSFSETATQKQDSARKSRDREERLRIIKDQQNLERQRKLDELKAQALAAQKYREQKEEERKRRIEEMRLRENDKRQQVEDRKKAIMDAERERREYILRKNQERDARLDTKRRNERSSISFAFGSSTPRLLDPVEVNLVVPSGAYWNSRRSTSISNVSYGGGTQLSRRSSERELSDGTKKRATSASGLDRPDDLHKMSTSMYEVFNWGHVNESRPKRLSVFAGASEINIDDPPPSATKTTTQNATNSRSYYDDSNDTSPFVIRSVARRKTDLIPTIPIRDSSFGSRTSLYCSTPRTQDFKNKGRAVSMTRLDQLAQPTRRKGEHIRAVIERERQQQIETNLATERVATTRKMSRSLTHLSSSSSTRSPAPLKLYQPISSASSSFSRNATINQVRPLRKSNATKSMTQLVTAKLLSTPKTPTVVQARIAQKHAYDIEIDSRTTNVSAGSRSGEVTPGGGSSRPGSAMSTSTMSTSGVVRRSGGPRKPRPSSIACTGMTPDSGNESSKPQKKDKPPSRPSSAVRRSSSTTSANVTKDASLKMSTSLHETPKRSARSAPPKKASTPRGTSTPKLPSPQSESAITISVPNEAPVNSIEIVQTVENVSEPMIHDVETTIETKTVETVTSTTEASSEDNENVHTVQETYEIKTETTSESEPVSNDENVDNNKLTEPENNEMTASMIQRRILSAEEAKAALAERRRLAREEAERQAELERQKQEEERLRQLKLQEEEEEKQRQFELEAQRLVEEQRQAEEKRLQQAIEEARQREEEERLRKADEEKQRQEREEQERKAREEAEKQKLEVAERLKKEEKEREERRKRVEAIMSRTRAKTTAANNATNKTENDADKNGVNTTESSQSSTQSQQNDETSANNTKNALSDYEKSVTDKENALIHTFSNLIENNLITTATQQSPQHHAENNGVHNNLKTNGKLLDFTLNDEHQAPISNGNGHTLINSLDNKIESGIGNNYNDSITNQLLDLSLDTNQTAEHTVNFNNNSLITSAPLVTSDSHEAKEISLL
ncbi:ensconsin-like isoform X2 [Contarinia nasturtii]|uniref:ensconsin-like isoform X2 n=1 Tax=Contarinia nasturtii TaxID=265458 RepID=UPI0012D48844|nr:ensconsin-like isoform X2 [Contarinia nasturtii]